MRSEDSSRGRLPSRRDLLVASAAGFATLPPLADTLAQPAMPKWPTRPVRLIVPFGPGAGADIGARLTAEVVAKKWGQGVVVENRPGGDSLIAIRAVANGNDDHQLLFSPSGNFTPHPYRHENLGYERERDLLPIARFSNTILAVGVSESLGVKTLQEMIAVAKKRPKELNIVVAPGITELVWDGFAKVEGVEITKVPFSNLVQGAGEMATGAIHLAFFALAVMQPVLQGKGARLLAVTSRQRVPLLPDVPTAIESGVPSLEVEGLVGLFGPRALSAELRRRIGEDVADVARLPQVAERLAATGQIPNPGGAEEFSADILRQEKQVAEIARLLGLERKG
jgi:tripartite-type tricarboxylate transporter receptor subunit TctC